MADDKFFSNQRVIVTVPNESTIANGQRQRRRRREEVYFGPFARPEEDDQPLATTRFYFVAGQSGYVREHHLGTFMSTPETVVDNNCNPSTSIRQDPEIVIASYYSPPDAYQFSGQTVRTTNSYAGTSFFPGKKVNVPNPRDIAHNFKTIYACRPLTKAKSDPYLVKLVRGGRTDRLEAANSQFVSDSSVTVRIASLEERIANGDDSDATALKLANALLELEEFGAYDLLTDLGIGYSLKWMVPNKYRDHYTPAAYVKVEGQVGRWRVETDSVYFADFDPFDTDKYKVTRWPDDVNDMLFGKLPADPSIVPTGYNRDEVTPPRIDGGVVEVALANSTLYYSVIAAGFPGVGYSPFLAPGGPMFSQRQMITYRTAIPVPPGFPANQLDVRNLYTNTFFCKIEEAEYYPVGLSSGDLSPAMPSDEYAVYNLFLVGTFGEDEWFTAVAEGPPSPPGSYHLVGPRTTSVSIDVKYYGEPRHRAVGAFRYKNKTYMVWTKVPVIKPTVQFYSCTFRKSGVVGVGGGLTPAVYFS